MANFKGYKRSIQLGFSYNEVKEGIPNVRKQMAMLNADFKSTSAAADGSGKSVEKLGVKYDYLAERIKIQEQSVLEYRKKLEDATNAEGNNTKAIQNNTASLSIAESKLAKTRAELEKVNTQLAYQQSTVDKNTDEWKKMETQLMLIDEEFKKNSIELSTSKDYVEKLTKEHGSLSEKLSLQEKQLRTYKESLEESTSAENKNEDAIRENKIEVAKAETAIAQTKSQLKDLNKELESQFTVLGKNKKEWDDLSSKMNSMGNSLSLKVTAPLIVAGAGAFKMAADYEQALGKMEVVFERNSGQIESWAKNALNDFGLAKSTAVEMASDFGALFKGMGFNIEKTADWSKTLTERTMDLANFYDTTVEETNRALNAIVTGQTEPLRRFGINMTQATLQEYAFANGIRKKISEMTEAEKVELRYNFVIERTNIALGTTARESDTATGQMNRLKETLKETAETFGTVIIPMVIPIFEFINNILTAINSLDEGTKKFIVGILGITAAVGPILILLGKVFDSFTKINGGIEAMSKLGTALSSLLDGGIYLSFLKWAVIISMVVGLIYLLIAAMNDFMGKSSSAAQTLGTFGDITGGAKNQIRQAQNAVEKSANIPGYARGTDNHPGGYAIVGEEGPELLNLPSGSKVSTHEETLDMLSSGDNFYLNVKFSEIDEVYKLINLFKKLKQNKRVMG